MTLAACCLSLVACPRDPEAWRLQLFSINKNLGTKALPTIAHDLELSCDGLQLACGGMADFYGEFFHVFILSFNCVRFEALGAWSLELISSRNFRQLFT